MKYQRILVKLSGEALSGNGQTGILSSDALLSVAEELAFISKNNVEIAVVIGAGNICRGAILERSGVERVTGDKMGMLGTIINSFALKEALTSLGVKVKILSAVSVKDFVETYDPKTADKYLKEGNIVIFAGGTGKPFYSTDTCAAMRSIEVNVQAILIAKHGVDGVYSDDPRINPQAKFYDRISLCDIIKQNLKVIDLDAAKLLLNKDIDICLFNMADVSNFRRVLNGEQLGTIITSRGIK